MGLSTGMPRWRWSCWNRSVDGGWLVVVVEKIQAFGENCKRSAPESTVTCHEVMSVDVPCMISSSHTPI